MPDRIIQQWRESELRLDRTLPDERRPAVDRVVDRLVMELRRRLGSAFTARELVDLYENGTDWCLDLATQIAPGAPWAWEARVFDAAFARYVNGATDFAGGRRIVD